MNAILETVRAWLRDNPVRVRAAIAAVVGWLSHEVPQVTEELGSETLTGVLTGLVALFLGESASRRVARAKAASRTYDGRRPPN